MNNSRANRLRRRRGALERRKNELNHWKKMTVTKKFSEGQKRNKIEKAKEDIKILEKRV